MPQSVSLTPGSGQEGAEGPVRGPKPDEATLRSILGHMLNGVAYCRMLYEDDVPSDFVYLYTNPAFHTQTGLGPVLGKRVSEVIPGILTADPDLIQTYGRVARSGQPAKFERFVSALGHWFSVDVFCPQPDHFVAVFDVITARKQRDDDLLRAQQRLALALRAAHAGIWDWDVARGTIEWSEGMYALLGLDPALAKPGFDSWRAALHPEDRAAAEAQVEGALRAGRSLFNEYRIVRPDGCVRWVQAVGDTRLDDTGAPVSMAGICIDATERKAIALELDRHRHHLEQLVAERTAALSTATQAAEAANLAKTTFLANMSHEIRTPLNAITGMAYLLRRSGVSPEQSDRLDRIDAAGQHLTGIIDSILDIARIDAGKLVLATEPVDVGMVLARVAAMLSDGARSKNLHVIVQAMATPRHLVGDAIRLQQAVLNFAANALKFTEAGSVTLRALTEYETAADALIRFEVQDTGIGIADSDVGRLFAPFEQADNSRTRRYGGTGLGLAITRRIAQLMGGEAGVHSTPGAGSTFWFTARLDKAVHAQAAPPSALVDTAAALARDCAGRRILLVEDEPVSRRIAVELLQEAGLTVEVACDGAEAVERCRDHPYDLILMDLQMPGLDGLEAARAIRRQGRCSAVPIVAMTANVFDDDRARCRAAGMDDFIAKPVFADVLYATVLAWLVRGGRDPASAPARELESAAPAGAA